jgi:hypothetical protein
MERLYSPCTRLHDILENENRLGLLKNPGEILQELSLDVSTQELLSTERAFTYADLHAMLRKENTVAWLTPHAAIGRDGQSVVYAWGKLYGSCRFCFRADGQDLVALARSPEHLLEICDVVLRLLAVSVVHSVRLTDWSCPDFFINAPAFAYLMEMCESLEFLLLNNLEMDEDHCRVLGTYSRPGLKIVLDFCRFTSAGASALSEVLGRNQGPTKLDLCRIDNFALADGLRGNNRLTSLRPRIFSRHDIGNQELLAIAGALRENKGLVDLELRYDDRVSDETWGAICDSLKTHPTLEVLNFGPTLNSVGSQLDPVVIKSRIQALLDMVKVNLSIHTINLRDHYSEHELFQGSVIPYLETNRFRPRVRSIQRTRPIPYRARVLGRALLAVRADANVFWMLLSGNAEVAFPSATATTTTAATLPTPTPAVATTSTTSIDAVAAISSATVPSSTVSDSVAAPPSASRKRLARS